MTRRQFLLRGTATAAGIGWLGTAAYVLSQGGGRQLLNASFDATRDLYREANPLFADGVRTRTGEAVRVRQSHGGSGSQARAVIDGLPADVVTLAIWPDVQQIARAGLIDAGWDRRPHALPYTSTIVFVVRRGNPHAVRDWADLARIDGLRLVAANPKTSGAAKLGLIACWGSVVAAGGSAADADALVKRVYNPARLPALESSSRAATVTFARKRLGDVHITWESEARLEVRESAGDLEIVYPTWSVKAEPYVAVVDAVARRNGTAALAEEYLTFLYTPAAQQVIADNALRPSTWSEQAQAAEFGAVKRFSIDLVGGWAEAQARFFADGGLFDRSYAG